MEESKESKAVDAVNEAKAADAKEVKEVKIEEKAVDTEANAEVAEVVETAAPANARRGNGGQRDAKGGQRDAKGGKRRKIETVEAPQSEWKERVVQIRRVTKVVKGGKKLSFRAIVVVGNGKGQVGVGCAKAAEVITAIQKAIAEGRKNLITVSIFNTTIPHPIVGNSGAGSVMLRPASQGTGVIAGGAVRAVLELAGIENILSKSLGSKAPLNAANATLEALGSLRTFGDVAKKRGMTVMEMLS